MLKKACQRFDWMYLHSGTQDFMLESIIQNDLSLYLSPTYEIVTNALPGTMLADIWTWDSMPPQWCHRLCCDALNLFYLI